MTQTEKCHQTRNSRGLFYLRQISLADAYHSGAEGGAAATERSAARHPSPGGHGHRQAGAVHPLRQSTAETEIQIGLQVTMETIATGKCLPYID